MKYNYNTNRKEFRILTTENGWELKTLHLDREKDLTVDIAIFKGTDANSLILHISGTHGVEGFVGSEIQKKILQTWKDKKSKANIVLVHGLNPFGMKNYRRVNENNVDLNRNALFDQKEWNDDKSNLYHKIDEIINPKYPYTNSMPAKLYRAFKMVQFICRSGFSQSKRIMVTGTYNKKYEKGLFYGGDKLQKSHILLRDFLSTEGYLDKTKNLYLIDVHTGMGKIGKDTIMISSTNTYRKKWLKKFFAESYAVCYTHKDSSNSVTNGYELTRGDVADNYPKLFKNLVTVLSVTQEFGTYNSILVALELIIENQNWHFGDNSYNNLDLYEIFSPLKKEEVKKEYIKRGQRVFDTILSSC